MSSGVAKPGPEIVSTQRQSPSMVMTPQLTFNVDCFDVLYQNLQQKSKPSANAVGTTDATISGEHTRLGV